jgi:hypothetical protein
MPDTGYLLPLTEMDPMTALGPDFIALQVRDLEASAAFTPSTSASPVLK